MDVTPLKATLVTLLAVLQIDLGCIRKTAAPLKKHYKNTHNLNKVTSVELLECVKILKQSPNKRELLFLEAMCIKSFKPSMNAQSEFSDRILKIFKH